MAKYELHPKKLNSPLNSKLLGIISSPNIYFIVSITETGVSSFKLAPKIGIPKSNTEFLIPPQTINNFLRYDANNDSYVMLLAVILLFLFSKNKEISQNEGILFFTLYIIYIFWLYKRSSGSPVESDNGKRTSYIFLIGGLIALLAGAQLTVDSAVSIAQFMGISEIVIGLSVVAVGTSLPELAGTISAARMGHKEIAVGNVIGSNIANIFLVMGILATINPISVGDFVIKTTLPLLILVTIAAFGLIRIPLTRFNGSILFAFFILFIYQLTLI